MSVKRGSLPPERGRKDPVMKRRRFTQDFKRSVVEQLLSETTGPAELCRRYNIASGQLYTWKKQYANGKLDPEPSKEAELEAQVRELERLLGKVTLENSDKFRGERKFKITKQSLQKPVVKSLEIFMFY